MREKKERKGNNRKLREGTETEKSGNQKGGRKQSTKKGEKPGTWERASEETERVR